MASIASPIDPESEGESIQVVLECNTIDDSVIHQGNHRTPPQIPNVYLDASASTVYFENPCYECTPEEYKILRPQMFGAIKYNGQWRGVRFTE